MSRNPSIVDSTKPPGERTTDAESGLSQSAETDTSPGQSYPKTLPSHTSRSYPLGLFSRLLLAGLVCFLVAGFTLAYQLEPDTRGYGTHQRLGLPPCTFRFLLGIPCPSCGMTTSFAHFVRGEFVSSLQANWVGTIMATVSALAIPWGIISLAIGRAWKTRDPVLAGLIVMSVFCGLSLVNWLIMLGQSWLF